MSDLVKMQLGTAVVDVIPAKVDRYLAQGFVILVDGVKLPYVNPPPKEAPAEGCC